MKEEFLRHVFYTPGLPEDIELSLESGPWSCGKVKDGVSANIKGIVAFKGQKNPQISFVISLGELAEFVAEAKTRHEEFNK